MPLDENLGKIFKDSLDQAFLEFSDSASQLLNSELSSSLSDFAPSKINANNLDITEPSFLLTMSLQDSTLGNLFIILNKTTAINLAAKMMGFEPAEEIDEAGKDALVSLFSQSLKIPGEQTQITSITLSELDPADPTSLKVETKGQELSSITVTINLGDFSSSFHIEIPNSLIEQDSRTDAEEHTDTTRIQKDDASISDTDFAEIKKSDILGEVDTEKNLNLLMDIRMGLIVELGRAEMHLRDILKLTKGSIIELDRLSGEPVDLFVNNKLVARGEVVVIDDNFGLRITQLAGTKNKQAEDLELLASGE